MPSTGMCQSSMRSVAREPNVVSELCRPGHQSASVKLQSQPNPRVLRQQQFEVVH